MSSVRRWHTPSALYWLQNLLQERFHYPFNIRIQHSEVVEIFLDGDSKSIRMPLYSTEFTRADSCLDCSMWNASAEGWDAPFSGQLFAPGTISLRFPLIEAAPTGFCINYDILGLTYWMLTRQEEVGRHDLDAHGRFPAAASHAARFGYLHRPIVDEWLCILSQVMARTWPRLSIKKRAFNMKVSHDVDVPSRYTFGSFAGMVRKMLGDLFFCRNLGVALIAPWIRYSSSSKLHDLDPNNTFDWIMDASENAGLISAFYFISSEQNGPLDADYSIGHPAIRALMRRIHARGHEIGLHPSYESYKNKALLKLEADNLRDIARQEDIKQTKWGSRMHYLRWEQPTTLRACAVGGMSYDSTLGYADRPGFRCGTCIEYQAFDPVANEALAIRIQPLIAMDCTVIERRYLNLGLGLEARNEFLGLKETCRVVGGCFTLLWHNSQLKSRGEKKLYLELLK
jgi:hypothetical protein